MLDAQSAKRLDLVDAEGGMAIGLQGLLDRLDELGMAPSEAAIDLLVVAASVFGADTSHDRERLTEDGWTRQFRLFVAVSDVDIWSAASPHLARMLQFLTGDFWEFVFRPRPKKYASLANAAESIPLEEFDTVSLFSGGLDSLIGAIDLLTDGRKPLFVSHSWDAQASAAQGRVTTQLKAHFAGHRYEILRAPIGLRSKDLSSAGSDGNQRARSFLFYAMASLVADAASIKSVLIPENGLIALNVPMEPFRLGSLSTRTAHPFFIECMEELASRLGLDIGFANPYRFKTKGQMVAECKDIAFLREIAHESMSCSSPAKARWASMPPQHCGFCVPCLIRRASLEAGLGITDQTPYGVPTLARTFDSRTAAGEHIRSFILAAKRVRDRPELAPYLVKKSGPLSPSDMTEYVDMYRHGMREVGDLLANTVSRHV
ncbi:hypothetical protein A0U43_00305 [Citromicrobium sp. RCC1897]|nr:hypothetical protein A0U43_00305 [Citromicrobium sp. RCC1897]